MILNTVHLEKSIKTLELSLHELETTQVEALKEVFRNAVIKGFELTRKVSGKLLRKALKLYVGDPRQIDELTYKDVLRHAAKHGILTTKAVERWFDYRNNRNDTAHDYGIAFVEETLKLIPHFLEDAYALRKTLQEKFG